jgi:regulatory protein
MGQLSIKGKAIALLARREHSRRELFYKLQQRGYAVSEIEPLLTDLVQQNLLSESRFIESYVRYRCNKGFGPLKIKLELENRGITLAQLAKIELWQHTDWLALARQVLAKKFGHHGADTVTTQQKQARYLQQRGFDIAQIQQVLNTLYESI